MIKVKVDIVPHGHEKEAFTISEVEIVNTLKINKKGQYKYRFSATVKQYWAVKQYVGEVYHFREDSAMTLLSIIFKKLEKEIKKDNESEKYED